LPCRDHVVLHRGIGRGGVVAGDGLQDAAVASDGVFALGMVGDAEILLHLERGLPEV
jgi:hypothetical protein